MDTADIATSASPCDAAQDYSQNDADVAATSGNVKSNCNAEKTIESQEQEVMERKEALAQAENKDDLRGTRFGSVRVAWHRRILGSNPGGSGGPPVTLAWEQEDTDRYETVEQFSETFHHEDDKAKNKLGPRMSKFERHNIALEDNTEAEISQVEKEMLQIRLGRFRSSKDVIEEEEDDGGNPKFRPARDSVQTQSERADTEVESPQNKAKDKGETKTTKQRRKLFSRFRR